MTWVRYDDGFTGRPTWDGISYEARWHYLALVEVCCRQQRLDGCLPLELAHRVSDVPHPDACLVELTSGGWLKVDADTVTVLLIDEHIPPPSVRLNAQQSKERMRRMRERKRLHGMGDHSFCEAPCDT
jgi:hypothetical protein